MRSWVEVSRRRLVENYRAVRAVVGPEVEVAAVVKANAYGHGAVEAARVLEAEGARWLAVASAEEGVELRQAGLKARILVMSDTLPESRSAFLEYDLTPVVHEPEELRPLDEAAHRAGRTLAYHLKMDSGMGRLGTRAGAAAAAEAVRRATHARLEGFMSHLASAGDYQGPQTDEQVRAFTQWRDELRRAGIEARYVHMAATTPVAYGRREAWGNLVRPGLSLYGYVSPPSGAAPVRILEVHPALTWKARLLAVKEVPAGAPIGYGALFRAPRPMRIGLVAAGYADGVSHRLSNRGQVIGAGKLVPILGAVSMDVTTIDVTECPSLQVGDAVTLLGSEGGVTLEAQQLAETAGTIAYDVLCRIGARVKRVWG